MTLGALMTTDGVFDPTAHAHLMRTVASHLTSEQMRAVAFYYAFAEEPALFGGEKTP